MAVLQALVDLVDLLFSGGWVLGVRLISLFGLSNRNVWESEKLSPQGSNVAPFSAFSLSVASNQDSRFKLFPNGTLRINNVEVYDGQVYGCETKTEGGRLSGQARVGVLGKAWRFSMQINRHVASCDLTRGILLGWF